MSHNKFGPDRFSRFVYWIQTNKQTNKQTPTQTNKQTPKQTDKPNLYIEGLFVSFLLEFIPKYSANKTLRIVLLLG